MNEKINSSDALVAYLDILGYSELVRNGGYANIYYGAIDAALYRWNQYLEKHKYNTGKAVKDRITLRVMSDSFIISLDQQAILAELDDDEGALRWNILMIFLILISYLIQDCMRQVKHLFRGAVVKGRHYQQKYDNLKSSDFIFSEALCNAHALEKNIAKTPRVLIDKSILSTLKQDEIDLLCARNRPDRELMRDNDGFYYLNVYASMVSNTALADILREVASTIRSHLEKQYSSDIIGKYIWYANYHDTFIHHVIASNAPASIPSFNEIKNNQQEMLIGIPDL